MRITRSHIRRIINEELERVQPVRRIKKIGARELRSMILKEARSLLKEHTIPDDNADINDMDAGAVWDIMVGETEGADELLGALGSVTGWAGGALKKIGAVDGGGLKLPLRRSGVPMVNQSSLTTLVA